MLKISLKLRFAFLASLIAVPVHALADSSRDVLLSYQEDRSFGAVDPDEPARPAEGKPYPRRDLPPEEPQAPLPPQGQLPDGEPRHRPKYRDIYEQASKQDRSYGDEGSVAVSIGVGFGFKFFAGNLGVTVPINRYVAWGVSGSYMTRNDAKEAEVNSGVGLDLMLRIPNPTPLMPFITAGPGMEAWRRSKDDGLGMKVFDDSDSPTANWSAGAALRLARYVALVGALKSTTYTERPPRVFSGSHSERELRTNERFELGFAFIF